MNIDKLAGHVIDRLCNHEGCRDMFMDPATGRLQAHHYHVSQPTTRLATSLLPTQPLVRAWLAHCWLRDQEVRQPHHRRHVEDSAYELLVPDDVRVGIHRLVTGGVVLMGYTREAGVMDAVREAQDRRSYGFFLPGGGWMKPSMYDDYRAYCYAHEGSGWLDGRGDVI